MYDRILCAHDFSECSKPALRAALDLGRQLKATVHVLHVISPAASIPPGLWFAVPPPDFQMFEEKVRLGAREELGRAVLEVSREGDPAVRFHVQLGEPGDAILATAMSIDAGLIVLGTHGRKGWQRVVLGSVAERVVRAAPVPVLTISSVAAKATEGLEACVAGQYSVK